MKGFKAYRKGLVCKCKQYREDTVYEEHGGDVCLPGMMHFCENPFDTLDYYSLIRDKGEVVEFTDVEALDEVKREDNKCATRKLKVGKRLSLSDMIKSAINFVFQQPANEKRVVSEKKGAQLIGSQEYTHLVATDDCATIGAIGYNSRLITSGHCSYSVAGGNASKLAATGEFSRLAAIGDSSKLMATGYKSHLLVDGEYAQLVAEGSSSQLLTAGTYSIVGMFGDYSKAVLSGSYSEVFSSGDCNRVVSVGNHCDLSASGKNCLVAGLGIKNEVKASLGSWIILVEWGEDKEDYVVPICIKATQVDGEKVKADTFYRLENGELVESNR